MYPKTFLTVCASIALLNVSCKKEDNTPTVQSYESKSSGNFLLETSVKNPDGMSGTSYLQLFNNLSGSIDNTQAEQVEFGASTQVEGSEVYIFDTMKGTGGVTQWIYNPTTKKLTKGKNLATPANSMIGHLEKVSANKAYLPLYTMGIVWIINPQTMEKTGEINLNTYAHKDQSPDPALGIIRDGKYFLCLDQVDPAGGWAPYADYLQCDVAVIDINTDRVEKIASEKTSGLSFPTRPMAQCKGMLFANEAGDLYMASVGYFGFNPNNTKCGFVCIPKGATEFDSNKSWDISTTEIEGYNYKAATVLNAQYLGDGKVAAYVGIRELYTENPYTSKSALAVIIDLNAKTIKKVDGVPLTDGHSVFITKYNNEAIFSAFGEDKIGFFSYNPTTGAVKQILTTIGNPSFFYAFQ